MSSELRRVDTLNVNSVLSFFRSASQTFAILPKYQAMGRAAKECQEKGTPHSSHEVPLAVVRLLNFKVCDLYAGKSPADSRLLTPSQSPWL